MKITKVSQLSGIEHTLELNITSEELMRVENRHYTTELIQNIVPQLTMDEREFLMTGITESEWNTNFAGEDEWDNTTIQEEPEYNDDDYDY
jgi:hypothetical protein